MPALTTREAARERLLQLFKTALDRAIPANESVPLKGAVFADFENQAYEVGDEVLAALMEERAKLDESALALSAGRCPYCDSVRTYLEKKTVKQDVRSPSGVVVIEKQRCRCRACKGSFSPSKPGLGIAGGSSADAPRIAAREP